jgi:hypothetical protein
MMPDSSLAKAATLLTGLSAVAKDTAFSDYVRSFVLDSPPVAELLRYLEPDQFALLTERAMQLRTEVARTIELLFGDDPSRGLALVEAQRTQFEAWHKATLTALREPGYTTAPLDVLTRREAEAAAEFLRLLLAAFAFASALLRGPGAAQPLAHFRFGELSQGFADLNLYLNRFVLAEPTIGPWIIEPKPAVGGYLPERHGFRLRWLTTSEQLRMTRKGLDCIAVGLYSNDNSSAPILSGDGYLVGTSIEQAMMLTSPGVHTSLPVHAFGERPLAVTDPLGEIGDYFADPAFCVHPHDYLVAVNRNQFIAAARRRRQSRCLICGSITGGQRICGRH